MTFQVGGLEAPNSAALNGSQSFSRNFTSRGWAGSGRKGVIWDRVAHWHNGPAPCASGDPGLPRWAGVLSNSGSSGQEEEEAAR